MNLRLGGTLLFSVFLAGCAAQQPTIVRVPVVEHRQPPEALLAPINPPSGDVFISPRDKTAVVGMSKDGKERLVGYIDSLAIQLEAWRAWATEK